MPVNMEQLLKELSTAEATEFRKKMVELGPESLLTLALKPTNAVPEEEVKGLKQVLADSQAKGLVNQFLDSGRDEDRETLLVAIQNPPEPPEPEPEPAATNEVICLWEEVATNKEAADALRTAIWEIVKEELLPKYDIPPEKKVEIGKAILRTFGYIRGDLIDKGKKWKTPEVLRSGLHGFLDRAMRDIVQEPPSEEEKTAQVAVKIAFGEFRRLQKTTWWQLLKAAGQGFTTKDLADGLKLGIYGPTEPEVFDKVTQDDEPGEGA